MTTYKEFCWCLGTSLYSIWWFVFVCFWPPLLFQGYNFFNFNSFLTIFNALNALIGGVQVLFKHQNNGALPLDLAYFEHLSVIVVIQFATNEQLKNSTHMFCLQIPCYKLYIKKLVLLCCHIKIHVPFWDEF